MVEVVEVEVMDVDVVDAVVVVVVDVDAAIVVVTMSVSTVSSMTEFPLLNFESSSKLASISMLNKSAVIVP